MARVVVVGAGVGGLAAAIRLRDQGHDVTVFEQNKAGGKLGSTEIDGLHFDTGPSLLTLPDVFEDLFAETGRSLGDYLDLVRLQQPFRYTWDDGQTLETFDSPEATQDSFACFGASSEWRHMFEHTEKVWEIAQRSFFSGPMGSPRSLVKRMSSPKDLLTIDALTSLHRRGQKLFGDRHLQQWWDRYATYSGSSPFQAPATLGCIPYIEQRHGAWHITGGVGRLGGALLRLANETGVRVEENKRVSAISHDERRTRGVKLEGGETHDADIVVSNVDAHHLYEQLLPNSKRRARVGKAGRSSSVFVMMLGVEAMGDTAHHNVWFSRDYEREFDQIFRGHGVPDDPTIYVCNSSVTDASQAPYGLENWFVLVNVGPGASTDWAAYGDGIVRRLGVSGRVRVREHLTPADIERRWSTSGGAIYGSSSNGRRSAFLRAANRGPIAGLYLCGGSSHPGGGLPLVAMSGKIVAEMIEEDWTGK